ncbi:MAG: Ig-like domain-containing protein [Planctomycetota bacterium]
MAKGLQNNHQMHVRLIVTAVIAVLTAAVTVQAADFRKGPYMIYPDVNTEMTVLWQSDTTPGTSSVEWGPTPSYGSSSGALAESGSGTDEHQFIYTITPLTPGARYYYRVTIDSQQVAGSFTAAPANDAAAVTLYAYGDTRTSPTNHDAVLAGALNDSAVDPGNRQTLMLHAADWNGNDDESSWDGQFFNRSYANTLEFMSKFPIMGCRGNHEGSAVNLRQYWPYAGSNCYYSFDYGPIHVTVIDQYVNFAPGSTQYNWIESDLSSSTKPFKIAMYHEPAWNADAYAPSTRAIDARNDLQPLFKQYGAMAIGGHNHNYCRAVVDGVTHITTGGGGAPLSPVDFNNNPYIVTAESTYHFCRLDVSGNGMTVTALRKNGTVIERFVIAGPGPEPVAADDAYITFPDTTLNIAAAEGVLANDFDPQSDPITAVLDTDVSNGTLVLYTDGSFDYTPDPGFTGTDAFTYHANDGTNNSLVATVTLEPGLVGHWKLDDGAGLTAVDVSGNGFDGTLVNGPTWTAGQINGALQFDGADDRVDIGDLGNTAYTVTMWAYFPADITAATAKTTLMRYGGNADQDIIGLGSISSYATDETLTILGYSSDYERTYIRDTLTAGWHFLTFVWDDVNMRYRIMVDNVDKIVYTGTRGETGLMRASVVSLAASDGTSYGAFEGILDDVRMFDDALSNAQITDIYNDDGRVDLEDFAELSRQWQSGYDINDLLDIANNWLYGTSP